MAYDRRYQHGVNGMTPEVLAVKMRRAIREVQKVMPANTGVTLFVMDFGKPGDPGGVAYISNAVREDMVKMVREWLARVDATTS